MSVERLVRRIQKFGDFSEKGGGHAEWDYFYDTDRYIVDYSEDFKELGWEQFDTDQDAPYFGQWVNPKTLQTLCYAEGDWTLIQCDTITAYNEEIQKCIDFYGDGMIADVMDRKGAWTRYIQDRSKFLIEETN